MKQFSESQKHLIEVLADGACHSGNQLGQKLNVSRTAIWKQINQLIEMGVPIQRKQKRGYCLPFPLRLLNQDEILQFLASNNFIEPIHFNLFASIDSTNRFLKEPSDNGFIDVCCSEIQTAGRGRFNRQWHSPFGENIYCSSRWHFNCDLSQLSGLSLISSLAVINTLKDIGIHEQITVKWPNDILWKNKKLCGSLIEINAESNSRTDVIIGIGLNVNSNTKNQENPLMNLPWCSLYEITGDYFNRNKIIARLIINLKNALHRFIEEGFTVFLEDWQNVDYLYNQLISVSHVTGILKGRAMGINSVGQLILIDEEDTIHYLSSGDTSLQSKATMYTP